MKSTFFGPTEKEMKYFGIPETIYHYTSPDGLLNILQNKQLWFSRYDCLNDVSEGKHIQGVYGKAIEKMRREEQIDRSFLDAIEDVKPNFYHFFRLYGEPSKGQEAQVIRGFQRVTKPYLCCFSRNRDSLPMWNYYSKNGQYEGYNIGFHYEETVLAYENIDAVRVIYTEADQIEILINSIRNVYEIYTDNQHSLNDCKLSLASTLSSRSIQFKNKAFEHEQEVRLVYWEPEDDNYIALNREETFYRQKKGIIIPYLKIRFEINQVRSMMIGPLIQSDIAEDTVKGMLEDKGYNSVKVDHSRIPIRY